MMEGFGVHTFRFIDAGGGSRFVKFHWRPRLGAQSVLWDEACKINGADQDFHRRDLWQAIARGDFPAFEFSVQVFDEAFAERFEFDVLDATKLIPEELVPLQPIGRIVLDRNPDNFFAETEQVAFHPGNLVPGIDVSDDPLLQGRLFSYVDTQLSRLGGPNFHQLPINRPQCPMRNFQRDGHMQMMVPTGRVAYEPNSLAPDGPREDPHRGFVTFAGTTRGLKTRHRSETFADHYSQARMFYRSLTESEKGHMIAAFAFELAKVETVEIRRRMLGHLRLIDVTLLEGVERALGMEGQADIIVPARAPIELAPSPALSLMGKALPTLLGRTVGALVSDGCDGGLIERLRIALERESARLEIIAPKIAGVTTDRGERLQADHALGGGPSGLFDAVVVVTSDAGAAALSDEPRAIDWVRDAYRHLKVIGYVLAAKLLIESALVARDRGVIELDASDGTETFVASAQEGRVWGRERKFRSPD